jgi:hypothetical protein
MQKRYRRRRRPDVILVAEGGRKKKIGHIGKPSSVIMMEDPPLPVQP